MGKKKTVAATRVRMCPKTTSVKATGSCKHEFTARFPVPWNVAGQELTPENAAALAESRERMRVHYSESPCPECIAGLSLTGVRETARKITDLFDVSPLPHMDGTVRQVSFAESVRLGVLLSHLGRDMWSAAEAITAPSVGEQLMLAGLKATWPGDCWLPRPASDNVRETVERTRTCVRENLFGYWVHHLDEHESPDMAWLAVWVVGRQTILSAEHLLGDTRIKGWIARGRSRVSRFQQPAALAEPTRRTMTSAMLLSWMHGWSNRDEAWTAYQTLRGSDSSLLSVMEANVGSPTEASDVFEQAAVMDALSRPRTLTFDPFPF